MNDEMNGNPQIQPTADQIKQTEQLLANVSPQIRAVLGTVFRGLMISVPGIPPHVVLQMVCFETGNFAGSALQGDLMQLIQLRKSFKEAFNEGVSKSALVQTPTGPLPNLRGGA